jgi:hypothetical protein
MKQKLKTFIIITMSVLISIISVYAFIRISNATEHLRGHDLLWKCFAIWIKSIILTQGVLVVGGLFLFLLRKPKALQ